MNLDNVLIDSLAMLCAHPYFGPTLFFAALVGTLYLARLCGGSWGWAVWGIFGPAGWLLAFVLGGAMRAHEAEDRRATSRRAIRRRVRRARPSSSSA